MKLLVSVVDAGEAREAAAAGADIVDVKNPAEGSLGAPTPAVIAAVREAVAAEVPVSAAIGDMPNLPGTAALAALGAARSGATYVKVGLCGVSTEDDAVALLRAVRDGARRRERWWWPPPTRTRCAWRTRRSRRRCCRVWRSAAGVEACLLDTAVKDGRGLLEWFSPDALTALVAEAHAAGLEMALAGALRAEDLLVIRATGADIAGVRSAVCRDGERSGTLDPARVRSLAACAYALSARSARRREAGGRPCARSPRASPRERRRPIPPRPPRPASEGRRALPPRARSLSGSAGRSRRASARRARRARSPRARRAGRRRRGPRAARPGRRRRRPPRAACGRG